MRLTYYFVFWVALYISPSSATYLCGCLVFPVCYMTLWVSAEFFLNNYEVNLLFRILSTFVYKFVISNLFIWMPRLPVFFCDSLSLGWKIDVSLSVRLTSVWDFDVLPWAMILSHSIIKLGILPCMYKYIGRAFIWWEAGRFFRISLIGSHFLVTKYSEFILL